jgi:hypothetical protein
MLDFINEREIALVREAVLQTDQTQALKPLFDVLNGELPYHKIRLALIWIEKNPN